MNSFILKEPRRIWLPWGLLIGVAPILITGLALIAYTAWTAEAAQSGLFGTFSVGLSLVAASALMGLLMIAPISDFHKKAVLRFDQIFKAMIIRAIIVQFALSVLWVTFLNRSLALNGLDASQHVHAASESIVMLSTIVFIFLTLPLILLGAGLFRALSVSVKQSEGDKMSES